MSAEEQQGTFLAIIAIVIAISFAIGQIVVKLIGIKKTRDMLLEESRMLCKDLKRILNDVNKDSDEELYEIDLSLNSYFKDNRLKIQALSNKLTASQVWYYPKNQDMLSIGEMFEWLLRDFYDDASEEEERIRIWSQNIPDFHSKYSNSFHTEPKIMTFPPK